MAEIVIFGAGDIAKLARYYFCSDSSHSVVAFTVDREFLKEEIFEDLPVVAWDSLPQLYPPSRFRIFIALSYTKMNKIREDRYLAAKSLGYESVSYISSKATILNSGEIGENCFILEDNTIQPFVTIGNNVTLWSGNHIGHDSVIEDNCFISSHVVISGHVKVGRNSFIGVNSSVREKVEIGPRSLISAGTILLENSPPGSVYSAAPSERRKITSDRIKL